MDGLPHPYRLVAAAILAALALIATAALAGAAEPIGTARKVVNKVYGATLNRPLRIGETLTPDQPVSTGAESATDLRFPDDTALFIGEQANLTLHALATDPRTKKIGGTIELSQGLVRFASAPSAKLDVAVKTAHGTFAVRGTVFDLLARTNATELAVREGQVAVTTPFGTTTVRAGEVVRIAATPPQVLPAASPEMQRSVRKLLSLLDAPDYTPQAAKAKQEARAALAALEQTAAFKDAIRGKKPENLLYLDTPGGRIVIEMLPDLAPRHVQRIRELVRAKFYDGQIFHTVQPGLAVETGDPTGTGAGGTGETIKPEIGRTSFVRGIVGTKHTRVDLASADSPFFIVLGPARHLDGRHTAWGRVIFGLETADKLKPGSPPSDPDRIIALRLAADPEAGSAKGHAISVPCRESDRRLGSC